MIRRKTRSWILRFTGIFFAFLLVSCVSGITLPAAPTADLAPTRRPPDLNRIAPESLPEVCNCVLQFDHLSIEDGLSQSSARVIFQDSRGFLWFGTEDGLNRYDGYGFKIYKPEPSNPNSLSDGWITAIVEDEDGYLWVGTRLGGVNRYDPFNDRFTQYKNEDGIRDSLIDNHVRALLIDNENRLWVGTMSGLDRFDMETERFIHYPYRVPPAGQSIVLRVSVIFQDSQNRFWIGTSDSGLNEFDPQTGAFRTYQQVEGTSPPPGVNPDTTDLPDIQGGASQAPKTISSNRISSIVEDQQGGIWVGTQNGLNLFDPLTEEFTQFLREEGNPLSIPDNVIYALHVDSTGDLWIGMSNGLARLPKERDRFFHYRNDPSFTRSLSNNFISSIYEDRGGVLWFGTFGGGVNKYDRGRGKFALYRNEPDAPGSLSGNFILPIHVDSQGYAWLGTYGDGLNRFDWKTGEVVRYMNDPQNPDSLGSNWIISLTEDQSGTLWVGTTNGLDRFNPDDETFTHYRNDSSNPDSLSANFIYTLYEDSKGRLWVGTFSGLDMLDKTTGVFIHYKPDGDALTSLSGNQVNSILEDNEGFLWVGTFESGLNRFDPETESFVHYRHNPKDQTSISSDSIQSVYQDSKGRLWIGTAGGGLNLYHPATDSFTYLLEKDGLPNSVIYGILEDEQGNLWMSTNYGLSRFDPDTRTFRNFDAGDGLQSNEFNSGSYAKGLEGEFYFGGINGLTVFHPSNITESPYLPRVALTLLTHDGAPVAVESSVETVQEVVLQWPQNSLEFEFAALSYSQPNKIQYAYRLDGFDTNWHFIGTKRDGRYTNLPGGEYTLLLKATNSDGVWNETPTRINVKIVPPFWQTMWFRVLIGVGAVLLVASGFRLRTRAIQERNRTLQRVVKERTYELEKRSLEIQALYEADERILRNVSLNQVFQTLVDVAVEMLNADRSVVFAWDEKQTKVVPRVSHGFSPETLKVLEFAKGEGIVGEVLATGKSVIVQELQPGQLRPDVSAAIIAEGIKSFAHLPIVVDHKVVAVFNVGFTRPEPISEDTMRLFSALAHRASLSITNMELFEQTKDLAVMEERNRLARDLHDSAKQKAFAALAQLGTARGILNGNGNRVITHLNEAENLVSDVIEELTFLVQEIYPIALQEKGLPTALREYIFEWENRNDIRVKFSTNNERRVPLNVEQALYRVAQESLANVARHSRAKRVDLSLVYNGDTMQLSLSDDGCGFDTALKSHGMGLRSIRERVSSVRGTVQVQSAPGSGTRILVQVPIKG